MGKINIAEILKDCHRGMELDCTINDDVKFIKISSSSTYPIILRTKNGYEITLTKYGQVHNMEDSKCVIFPKGKTTWEGFVPPCKFKDGDILATKEELPIFKIGDRIKLKNSKFVYTIIDLLKDRYRATTDSRDLYEIEFERQDVYILAK